MKNKKTPLKKGDFKISQHGIWGICKDGGFGVSFCEYQFRFGSNKKKLLDFLGKRKYYLLEQIVKINDFIREVKSK